MQKGMELNLIVSLILAIVAVGLFIMLVSGDLKSTTTSIYCNTFAKLSSGDSVPEICQGETITHTSGKIESNDSTTASREILSYIIACWEKSGSETITETYTCYELELPGDLPEIGEEEISEILSNEDRCKSIENSDYDCGILDQILWEVEGDTLTSQTILFIEYDPSVKAVRVLG